MSSLLTPHLRSVSLLTTRVKIESTRAKVSFHLTQNTRIREMKHFVPFLLKDGPEW